MVNLIKTFWKWPNQKRNKHWFKAIFIGKDDKKNVKAKTIISGGDPGSVKQQVYFRNCSVY